MNKNILHTRRLTRIYNVIIINIKNAKKLSMTLIKTLTVNMNKNAYEQNVNKARSLVPVIARSNEAWISANLQR